MRHAYRDWFAQTVLVSLKTGAAVRGVLWTQNRDLLVVRNADLIEAGQRRPVDGEVLIERSNVEMVQVVAPRDV